MPVFDWPYRFSILGDYECREILIDDLRVQVSEMLDRIRHAWKAVFMISFHMNLPSQFDFTPVMIAVHGHGFPATPTGKCIIAFRILLLQLPEQNFQTLGVFMGRLDRHIPTIKQCMDITLLHPGSESMPDDCLEVTDMAVDVSVRKQTHQMQGNLFPDAVPDHHLHGFGFKQCSGVDQMVDQGGPLFHHHSGSHGHVAHFRTPEVFLSGKADMQSMSPKLRVGTLPA